ncbi:MAG: DUF4367 domain-containing protein [Actinomycetota bacterium]|nr:DUF4367 domain-containing protein [Actinomycetota bacterium]
MKRLIIGFCVLVFALAVSGCQPRYDNQSTTTTTQENVTLEISVLDAKTKENLPTASWVTEIVGNGSRIYSESSKQEKYKRIFNLEVSGIYDITITASGYFPEHKVINIKPGESKVRFALRAIPPQTSEKAIYDKLRKFYSLRVYRPSYLPNGFKIAPYTGPDNFKHPNPHIIGTEAEVDYESSSGKIRLRFGVKGDIGATLPPEHIKIAGNTAYIAKEGNNVTILWHEKAEDDRYLYMIQSKNVSKWEVIKFAESLYVVE